MSQTPYRPFYPPIEIARPIALWAADVYRLRMDKNLRDVPLSPDTSWWVKGPPLVVLVLIVLAAIFLA